MAIYDFQDAAKAGSNILGGVAKSKGKAAGQDDKGDSVASSLGKLAEEVGKAAKKRYEQKRDNGKS